jgi:hypothetical protein
MNSVDISTTIYGKYGQIGVLIGANMNSTADQLITLYGGSSFIITDIVITNSSTSLTSASDLEFYSQVSRGGNSSFHSGFSYLNHLSGNSALLIISDALKNLVNPTNVISLHDYFLSYGKNLDSNDQNIFGNSLYASLGTPQGVAATADIYIYGYILA